MVHIMTAYLHSRLKIIKNEKIKSRDDLFQILNVTENVEIIETGTKML